MALKFIGKCLFIEEDNERVLVVGDLHLGYEESLNESGVFVTRQMFKEMIEEFELVFSRVGDVDKVILLGDLKHEIGRPLRQEWNDVLELFDYFYSKVDEIIVIKGNHDNYLQNIVSKAPKTHAEGEGIASRKRVEVYDSYKFREYIFFHGDKDLKEIWDENVRVWVMGHLHPAVELSEGNKSEKYKCFLDGKFRGRRVIIVPSFTEYSGGIDVRHLGKLLKWPFRLGGFEVKIVGENFEVLDFGKLRNLK